MSLGNNIYKSHQIPAAIKTIAEKVFDSKQISTSDALELFNSSKVERDTHYNILETF